MISAGVIFTNDRYPRAFDPHGDGLADSGPNEDTLTTAVGEGATIGAGAVIGPGITIGAYAHDRTWDQRRHPGRAAPRASCSATRRANMEPSASVASRATRPTRRGRRRVRAAAAGEPRDRSPRARQLRGARPPGHPRSREDPVSPDRRARGVEREPARRHRRRLSPAEIAIVERTSSLVLGGGDPFARQVFGATAPHTERGQYVIGLDQPLWPTAIVDMRPGREARDAPAGRAVLRPRRDSAKGTVLATLATPATAAALPRPAIARRNRCIWSLLDLGTAFANLMNDATASRASRRRARPGMERRAARRRSSTTPHPTRSAAGCNAGPTRARSTSRGARRQLWGQGMGGAP